MVDDIRTFLLPQHPLYRPDSTDDLRGVAALFQQFFIPISLAHRLVTHIGAVNPKTRSLTHRLSQPYALRQQAHLAFQYILVPTNNTATSSRNPSLTFVDSSLPKFY